MKPLIVLPVVHEETTDACISSIAPKYRNNLLVVDNSVSGFAHKYELEQTYTQKQNIGVSRSWNLGVKTLLRENHDFLIILSASLVFTDGMESLMEALRRNYDQNGMMTQEGWHCIAIHRRVFDLIGNFDTNFYPGYFEDSDFIRRMELAKIHEPTGKITFPGHEIQAKPAEVAHSMKRAKIQVNMQACADYFIKKWGDYPRYTSQEDRDALYKHPFNNPEFDLKYYEEHTIEELKLAYNLA